MNRRYVVGVSGASGSEYAFRLMQMLPGERNLVMSKTAKEILEAETDHRVEEMYALADKVFEDDCMFASIASGSHRYDCMFIAPCSESTVAKIANGIADTLITRAASVCIKEGRKLILLVRETPKSAIMLENELKLARLGVVIMDANPGFYPRPETVSDIVDIVVGRCLDQAGIDAELYRRWE
ncbi:MAG: UbiX family flavin prenyltransferase [Candidatus Methanomethylophilaceae archaeon]|nr:UbiX family flavin prenyltransferase [Candidatus Methanomethylophilaceae archaeon]